MRCHDVLLFIRHNTSLEPPKLIRLEDDMI
jgi:hypothetical protein